MISSMTGFGRGSAESESGTVTVEIKSVNSRYCEVSVRLPRTLSDRETEVQALIKKSVARGRVSVQIQSSTIGGAAGVGLNAEAARKYAVALRSLVAEAELAEEVRLEHLLRFPEVVSTSESSEEDRDQLWATTEEAISAALAQFHAMRRDEGSALGIDLASGIEDLRQRTDQVEVLAPDRVVQARQRLQDRIADAVGNDVLDQDRLEQEIAVLADKLDLNEELVRLKSHLVLFAESLASSEPIGRRLNFIAQEINREVNTIGSKANDPGIARLVVEMKETLERIREQIENVQ